MIQGKLILKNTQQKLHDSYIPLTVLEKDA